MGFKISAVLALIMIVISVGSYWYYKDSQNRLAMLQADNAELGVAVQLNEEAIRSLEVNYQQAAEELNRVNTELTDSRIQNKELQAKLSKHDLGVLAETKPKLVEKIVNSATVNANRCFELLSGAPLTTKEREAKNAKDFNSECPWLFDGSTAP